MSLALKFNKLSDIGIETAREFLEADPKFIMDNCDITSEQLLELRSIMLSEFEEQESEEVIQTINAI